MKVILNMDDHEKDILLKGNIINLRKINVDKDIRNGSWHTWFNDIEITQNLEHGIFPVSREEEIDIVEKEIINKKTLILAIVNKLNNNAIGVISLKDIDYINRRAEIGIVMGFDKLPGGALEAMTLITEHGFKRLNLNKIYCGQYEGLWKWVEVLSLVGFKIEGLRREHAFRDGRPIDIFITGVTSSDFFRLEEERGGDILSGDAFKLQKTIKLENRAEITRELISKIYN